MNTFQHSHIYKYFSSVQSVRGKMMKNENLFEYCGSL
jgi:hypothetical protein